MHVVFRESHGLEGLETPVDLNQDPADLVVLSFSDSDLGAFAEAWHQGGGRAGDLPSLRLANLAQLRHPLSVDTYAERTLEGAKGILVRLIGGRSYWDYGLSQLQALAQRRGMALAVLPGDGRPDPQLDAVSTLPISTLRRLAQLCDAGGTRAAQAALSQLALASGLTAAPVCAAQTLPEIGLWTPETGAEALDPSQAPDVLGDDAPLLEARGAAPRAPRRIWQEKKARRILLVFYRAYLVAADMAPITALFDSFRAEGCDVVGLFAPSLKAPAAAATLRAAVAGIAPDAIVNATAFSARGARGAPLDAAGVPVFQVALATSTEAAWAEAERGLSPADLAMHVVLPEVDGRLFAGVVSFKQPGARDPDLQFARNLHAPHAPGIARAVARVMGWLRLTAKPAAERRVALMLSTYPGKTWNLGHAVGLDAPASARAILEDLRAAGYAVPSPASDLGPALQQRRLALPLAEYAQDLARLPRALRNQLADTWGAAESDPLCQDGAFHVAAFFQGTALIALQPERGLAAARGPEYHDLARVPRHSYVAVYLWLQHHVDALIHVGAHGTLEWLPGKAVALSDACWPQVLTGALPVLYPFIVNDPGEAAQAKRRIGALTLGHLPPPLRDSETPDGLAHLEALLDEFSTADGLDPRRRDRLQAEIRAEARARGLDSDLGLDAACSAAEAIPRIDRFVCDIKDSRFGEGLHVWGRTPQGTDAPEIAASAQAERAALVAALDGRRIEAGPSGSPWRGRRDVLPSGRNLYTTDPRAVPTRAAFAQGAALAEALVRRHLQDSGDWPRGLVVDLWGSATMRTAGEEFAMALHLIGIRPRWDPESGRVCGFEILPIAELERPRIDVTLRVSGLFRDVFPALAALFTEAVAALAKRDEAPEWNPYAGTVPGARVYGPAPGSFGLGMAVAPDELDEASRRAAGEAWLAASSWALSGAGAARDEAGIRARVAQADAFVHPQDLPETDLLLAADYAAHEAGFAAAQALVGGRAALYHLDSTDPARPRARALSEEIARVVQARAANPRWIAGMRRHGLRGAAEIAATLEHMAAFAHLAGVVGGHLFDLYHAATLGDPETERFLRAANPAAHAAMSARFRALHEAGLWTSRRNSVIAALEERP
ncbi:cobaltochelatase subunit CobN [Salipiger mangrovisoli]|uniref:Cobaltochelatase subunit CobN n=1 Tax=Salipiger mangrovisoli TaxID=2865933 RepID=A0ABR9X559_9RHOB|nr:cobaltochelatase subunit CobN [Salipiger mangrovisoli]MBE9638654.1 cobaltochelatase subunit CobN [Salipiger mangrovisoli]